MKHVVMILVALLEVAAHAQPVLRLKVPAQKDAKREASTLPARTHYLVQFSEAPSEEIVSAIESQGIAVQTSVVGEVPDFALLVAADAPLDWAALGGG